MWKVLVIASLCVSLASAWCPKHCRCPSEVPACPGGASLVLDSCGCCKVCARQLFEDCSRTRPCDSAKGLECNFGGGFASVKGVCRARSEGRTCEYNGRIFQNGETFRPNCKHQCTCMDGSVGCVSLCPQKLSLAKLGCAKPKRVKAPGGCCEQLVCPKGTKTGKKERRKHRKEQENDPIIKNKLMPYRMEESKALSVFRNRLMGHVGAPCVPQTTAWSPCSRSCGTGVSTRLTNRNARCKLQEEARLCKVQPCKPTTLKKQQKWTHTESPAVL
ncbi:CCN family member 1-like [Salarias fasciatus]|uniref:CCN family member 1-like n=1 Tax=Salarias fasciatus TaxID=181472 RepID=UPI00117689B6|nr:CCN family member 1-like [Salarias fasciatus]